MVSGSGSEDGPRGTMKTRSETQLKGLVVDSVLSSVTNAGLLSPRRRFTCCHLDLEFGKKKNKFKFGIESKLAPKLKLWLNIWRFGRACLIFEKSTVIGASFSHDNF